MLFLLIIVVGVGLAFMIHDSHEQYKFLERVHQLQMDSIIERNKNLIELHVLVDKDGRISYTGEYKDLKSKQTPELKLVKLEGVL